MSISTRQFVVVTALLVVATTITLGFSHVGTTVTSDEIPSPDGRIDSTADAVPIGAQMFVSVASEAPGQGTRIDVYASETTNAPFVRMPQPETEAIDGGWRSSLTRYQERPCVSFTPTDQVSTVRCLDRATQQWIELPEDPSSNSWRIIDLHGSGNSLYALLAIAGDSTKPYVKVSAYDGVKWQQIGQSVAFRNGVMLFDRSDDLGVPELSVVAGSGRSATRFVLAFRTQRWKRATHRIPDTFGSLVSGSVKLGRARLIPVIRSLPSSRPWRFSIYSDSKSGSRQLDPGVLNHGRRSAQGGIWRTDNGDVWTAWVEDPSSSGNQDRSSVYVARINVKRLRVERPFRVWTGKPMGIGPLHITSRGEETFLLYGRPRSGRRGGVRFAVQQIAPFRGKPQVALD